MPALVLSAPALRAGHDKRAGLVAQGNLCQHGAAFRFVAVNCLFHTQQVAVVVMDEDVAALWGFFFSGVSPLDFLFHICIIGS